MKYLKDQTPSQILGLRSDVQAMTPAEQANLGEIVAAALAGMGFYVDGHKLGQLINTQNANLKIAAGR